MKTDCCRHAGQNLGPRSRRQRMGSVRGAEGQPAGDRGRGVMLQQRGLYDGNGVSQVLADTIRLCF